jgi:hypothetical protein
MNRTFLYSRMFMKKSFLMIVGCLLSTAAVANSNTSVTLDQSAIFNKNGFSRVIEFQIAPETTSFIIQATGKRGSSIAIKAVQDPAGHYITGESFSLSESPKISALTNSQNPQNISYVDGFSSMLVPNNGAVAVIPGKWKLQAMCYSEPADCTKNPVRVLIMSKTYRGEVKSANATVPVRLRFTGARGWYAQNALQHPTFLAVLTLLNEKMRMAGLNLKIVGLSDAPASPSLKSFEESLEFVRGEFSNKVPANENAINITFATGTQAFPANAISFGLPGPISTSGRDGFGSRRLRDYSDR